MTDRTLRRALEKSIETKVVTDAYFDLGVPSIKLGLRYDVAYPDRLFFIPGGRPLFIEFKVAGEDPNPLQEHKIELLRGLGYDVRHEDSYEGAMSSIRFFASKGASK